MSLVCQRCNHDNSDEAKFCLNCGAMLEVQTVQAPEDPFVGRVLLGRYRVLGVLGEGGMGKVYLAEQKMGTATRNVAIKTLHPELGADQQLVARFHRECETVIQLSHPNTVQFYDFGDIDGTLFIVMEYIEGESLAHVLGRGAVDPAHADRILIQICGSLNEAHQRGIVHRDLKPENVLLTERGGQPDFVKVLDFGIAKRSEAEDKAQAKLTKQGMVLGTPPYMSPEQFSGQQLDARSDIYSLGIMSYEMLAGRLPFDAATPWEWATKHLTAQPTPLEALPGGAELPERKRAAIYRALSKERDQRQASALEFMHEFTGLSDAGAWTLASLSGAAASASGAGAPSGGPAPARTPAPTPGPLSAADPAYAATMATPASGQMAATPPPPGYDTGVGHGTGGVPGRRGGVGKALLIVAIVAFLAMVGGAAGVWLLVTAGGGDSVATASEPAGDDAPATAGEPADDTPQGVPSTPPGPEDQAASDEPDAPAAAEGDPTGSADEPSDAAEEDTTAATDDDEPANEPTHRTHRASSAQAARLAAAARSALDRGNLPAAARTLAQARRAGGRRVAAVRSAVAELGRKGSIQVGILMQQGKCPAAQALYRQLRAAGADGPSKVHFSGDWCPRP